jgi:hypothetical protein
MSEMAEPEAERSAPPRAPLPTRVPTDGWTRRRRVASRWRPTVCSVGGDLTGGPQLLPEQRLMLLPAQRRWWLRRRAPTSSSRGWLSQRTSSRNAATVNLVYGGGVSSLNPRVSVLFVFDLKLPLFLTSVWTRSATLTWLWYQYSKLGPLGAGSSG